MTGMTGLTGGWALQLLGPARLERDGDPVDLGSPQRLALLAVLALAHGHPSSMKTLVDGLWGTDPPSRADVAVRSHVSVLRRVLEPARAPRSVARVVLTHGGGYALAPSAVALDVTHFRRLVGAARQKRRGGDPEAARVDLSAALGLWRGEALGGLPGPSATLARALLADERLLAWEDLLEVELDTDTVTRPPEGLVRRLLAERPHRERLHALLVRTHHAAGRRDEALAAFDRAREALAEDLGLEPGAELLEARRRVLAEPRRSSPVVERVAGLPRAVPAEALGPAAATGPLLGRHALLCGLVEQLRTATGPVHVRGGPGSGVTAVALAGARAAAGEVVVVGPAADAAARRDLLVAAVDRGALVLVTGAGPVLAGAVLDEVGERGRSRLLLAGTHRLPGLPGVVRVEVPPLDEEAALALLHAEISGARTGDDPSAIRAAVAMSGGLPRLLVAGGRSLAASPGTSVAAWVQEVTAPGPDAGPSRARQALDQLLGDRLAALATTERLVLHAVGLHPPGRVPRAALAAVLDLPLGIVSTALATLYDHGLIDHGPEGARRPEEYRASFAVWYHASLTGEGEDDPVARVDRVDRLLAHYGALLRSALDERVPGSGGPWAWLDRHEPTLRALVHRWSARPACRTVATLLAEATAVH